MKIINADWERRNLGVDCQEISFSVNDSIDDYYAIQSELVAEYQIARIPSGATMLLLALQEQGFKTIEVNLHLERTLHDFSIPSWLQRFESRVAVSEPTSYELEYIFQVIESGVFNTDKVALDPQFSLELSGRRYSNWIRDELNKESKCYILKLDKIPLGFDILKKINDKKFNALFGALFPEAQDIPGVGALLPYYNCMMAKRQGGEHIITGVSSNNLQALRTNLSMGFVITELNYILVKHL